MPGRSGLKRVHFIDICGRATGALAACLARKGVIVTGSDGAGLPPMSEVLRAAGIKLSRTPQPHRITRKLDCVVISGGATPGNPEFAAAIDRGVPWMHFAPFLGAHFLSKSRNIVVAGTNGKTTTTALLAWIFDQAGKRPNYLIGGLPHNLPSPARFDSGRWAIIEGDEYWTGIGDVRPKFLHYHPQVAVITNIQHDHPEVYADEWSYLFPFKHLIDFLPSGGTAVLNADDRSAGLLAPRCRGKTITVGFDRCADLRVTNTRTGSRGSSFRFSGTDFSLPLAGRMNVLNAAMAIAAAKAAGITPRRAREAVALFRGVVGRQEVLFESGGITVLRDEAYHPESLRSLIEALRARYPQRRLILMLRPRSTGSRLGPQQQRLPDALAGADLTLLLDLPPAFGRDDFSPRQVVRELRRRGLEACHAANPADFLPKLRRLLRAGDVIVLALFLTDHQFAGQLEACLRGMRGKHLAGLHT